MSAQELWDWSEDDLKWHFKYGACHVLAAAFQSLTKLPLAIMWNPFDWHVEPSEEDGAGGVLQVAHVYVREPSGEIIDIEGRRSLEEMRKDMAGGDWDACPCEPLEWVALMSLVNDSGNLEGFTGDDIRDAVEVIRRNPALAEIVQAYDPDFEVHPAAAVLQPS